MFFEQNEPDSKLQCVEAVFEAQMNGVRQLATWKCPARSLPGVPQLEGKRAIQVPVDAEAGQLTPLRTGTEFTLFLGGRRKEVLALESAHIQESVREGVFSGNSGSGDNRAF